MELITSIQIPKPPFGISYADRMVLMGSCFAENIGERLESDKFRVDNNPFGTLYNPASIAEGLRRLLRPTPFTVADLFAHAGSYHNFAYHSRFSATTEEETLRQMNDRLLSSAEQLREASRLILTWGTAYVYRLKSDGRIVANCHKLPEQHFVRERLSVEAIVDEWRVLLTELWSQCPHLKLICTVSPIRHWKDGAHANQLSKATLLLALGALRAEFPDRISYFPAYEILLDELRDYRFYADDMLHPSSLAVDYIADRFAQTYFDQETQKARQAWDKLRKAIVHRPLQPESETYRQFITQTLLKLEQLKAKMPFFDFTKESEILIAKLR
ncbi:MAG: GSCFA domain-containing protein [Parabacteroides sp.]